MYLLKYKKQYISYWDFSSWLIIFLFLFVQILRWKLFPLGLDIYYHLSTMLGFNTAGGYVLNSFWELAPVGRPHLYPPLFHILLLLFYKIGFPVIFIARFFNCIIVPLSIFVFWLVIKSIFNRRLAFFVVLITASVYPFYLSFINTIPASLSILFGLLGFLSIENNKKISAIIFLTFSFYTHILMFVAMFLTILIYKLLNRSNYTVYLKIVSGTLILSLPLLIHLYLNRSYVNLFNIHEIYFLEIDIVIFILALLGVIICFKKKKLYHFFVAFAIALFLALAFNYSYRYFCAQGLVSIIFLAAVSLDYIYEKITLPKKTVVFFGLSIIFLYMFSPAIAIYKNKYIKFSPTNSTYNNLILSSKWKEYRVTHETSFFHPEFYNKTVEIIKQNTSEGEIIYSNINFVAQILNVFSGRAISTAMLDEVKPRYSFDPVRSAKLMIWVKYDKDTERESNALINKYRLSKINETDLVFIYKNPASQIRRSITRPFVYNSVLFSILFIFLGLIILDQKRANKKYH